jgi:hypothetical protein
MSIFMIVLYFSRNNFIGRFYKKRTFSGRINSQDNCWHVFGARCRIIYKWRKGYYHTFAQGVLSYFCARGSIILLRGKWFPNGQGVFRKLSKAHRFFYFVVCYILLLSDIYSFCCLLTPAEVPVFLIGIGGLTGFSRALYHIIFSD